VAIERGVESVNDSIATSPERTIAALETFDRPIRWLAGGRDKKLPLDRMIKVAASKPIHAYLYGEFAPVLAAALRNAGASVAGVYEDLETAFLAAANDARPEEIVLLSPACTSFDQYRDYDARGKAFRGLVQNFLGREAVSR
jgi:UDP-N-acetylmuramoylalanine--D-glutamate ligase